MKQALYRVSFGIAILSAASGIILQIIINSADFLGTSAPGAMQNGVIEYGPFAVAVLAFVLVLLTKTETLHITTHGSAHFATLTEIRTAGLLRPHVPKEVPESPMPSFLELGTLKGRTVGLTEHKQESHVLLVAPTGKGKTSGVIIPALLQERGHRDLFVNDVKMELIKKTADALSGYMEIQIFRPTDPEISLQYNPLAFVDTMEDAEDLATCFIENTGESQEQFWNAAAKLLLTAVIMHLRATEPDAPFCRIADILTGNSVNEVKNVLLTSQSRLVKALTTTFMKSVSLNEKLAGSIMVDMSVRLLALKNPSIRHVTATNEIRFDQEYPTALFLSIPTTATKRLKWLSSCLIMQRMNDLIRRAEQAPDGRLPRGYAFYLDELANAGYIPHFTAHMSLVRSAGISFLMAIQNFGQLKDIYKEEGKDTILANATTHVVYPGCGLEETRFYSERMGNRTVESTSRAKRGREGQQTISEASRRLMNADELRTMPLGQLAVISDNIHPFLVNNTPYYKRPEMNRLILPYTPPMQAGATAQVHSNHYGIEYERDDLADDFRKLFLSD